MRANPGELGELAGQVAVVTGAAQGIGAAITRRLATAGACVAALDRQWADSPNLPKGCRAYRVDVRDAAEITRALDQVEQDLGPVTVLVNNAGVLHLASVLETTEEQWEATFSVNVDGVRRMSTAVARLMVPRRRGSIVTVASNAGNTPRTQMGAYCASKAASAMFTKVLGLELAKHGVRCNVVAPGSTLTDMQRQLWDGPDGMQATIAGTPEHYKLPIPLGRVAAPEDIAEAVCFLASDRARHITLHQLVVDGGATLGA